MRPTAAVVDLDAIRSNVTAVAAETGTAICAVVKADAYGHGAVRVARAALEAGATWLGVALVEEGIALREARMEVPILVLAEVPPVALAELITADLTPTVGSAAGLDALAGAGGKRFHLKIDTGMRRQGCAPEDAPALVERAGRLGLRVEGVWTHCAVADRVDDPFTTRQLNDFDEAVAGLGVRPPIVHAANSAAALAAPAARHDLVRIGLAMYGIDPRDRPLPPITLLPALELRSEIVATRRIRAGDGVSYGLEWTASRATTVATVPIGYADGVPRRAGASGVEVLVGGRRRAILGAVTMDQLMIDVGDERGAEDLGVGAGVVVIGRQGDQEISAMELADRLGVIPYEVLTGISTRVRREYRP